MTSPRRTPRRPGPWTRTGLVALLVVVAAEAGVRQLEPHLPGPELWADEATAVKALQLERIGSAGCVDVVFAGNSMTRDALDPEVFTRNHADGATAYNAALDAASPELLRSWLLGHVVPIAQPGSVVIGLASFDLNDGASITRTALAAFQAAPLSATGTANELEALFVRNIGLVRHRAALRSPETVASSVRRWWDGDPAVRPSAEGIPGVLASDGHGLSRRAQQHRPGSGAAAFAQRELLNDFRLGGTQARELRALVDDLRAAGVDVALLVLPVTPEYVTLHPRGERDQESFDRLVAEIGRDARVPVIHSADPGAGGFADTHHLNGDGSREVSRALPAQLHDAGVGAAGC